MANKPRYVERDSKILQLAGTGLSYKAIAERFGLAPGTIGVVLSRARKRQAKQPTNEPLAVAK